MATTSPDNLRTPDPGDPYNLVADLAVLANDVQGALIARGNVFRGTAAQRVAFLSTASAGMLWQDTDDIEMLWKRGASQWVPAVWHWSGTTAQMNSFAAPNGFQWYNTTTGFTHFRIGGSWVSEWQEGVFTPASGTLVLNRSIWRNAITGATNIFISCSRSSWTSGGTTNLGSFNQDAFKPAGQAWQGASALNGVSTPYAGFAQITTSGSVNAHNSPTNGQNWAVSITASYKTAV